MLHLAYLKKKHFDLKADSWLDLHLLFAEGCGWVVIMRFQLYYWADLLLKDGGERVIWKLGAHQLSEEKSTAACVGVNHGTRLQFDLSSLRLCC